MIFSLRPALSDRHPYAISEEPCTFITMNLPPLVSGGEGGFPHLHCMLLFINHLCTFLFLNTLGTSKKIEPPLLKFSMFHFWPKVSLDSLKSQRKIPSAACELKRSAKTKKHFPPFETASSHMSLGSETPTIQHKEAAHKTYGGLTPPFNRATPGLAQAMAAWKLYNSVDFVSHPNPAETCNTLPSIWEQLNWTWISPITW